VLGSHCISQSSASVSETGIEIDILPTATSKVPETTIPKETTMNDNIPTSEVETTSTTSTTSEGVLETALEIVEGITLPEGTSEGSESLDPKVMKLASHMALSDLLDTTTDPNLRAAIIDTLKAQQKKIEDEHKKRVEAVKESNRATILKWIDHAETTPEELDEMARKLSYQMGVKDGTVKRKGPKVGSTRQKVTV
jgi:hypothetical protein